MNKFNKLYNLILESIISLNKAQRKAMLLKAFMNHGLKDNIINSWEKYFSKLNNKIADFICKYVASGDIKDILDKRLLQIKNILARKTNIDIQQDISLDLFLKQNETYINRSNITKKNYLDSIPEFYDKKEYDKGVVVYRVKDDKAGMNAVRKVVDTQWGYDANPWCLISRKENTLKYAWRMWNGYNAYPKQIAFQNGKLVAFRANSAFEKDMWWDRLDQESSSLYLLDGSKLRIPVPDWTEEEIKDQESRKSEIFKSVNGLEYNEQTQKWDSEENVIVKNKDLINGRLPLVFGRIEKSFSVFECEDLISLLGAPDFVGEDYIINGCNKLSNLKGSPKEVGLSFNLSKCTNLINLLDGPKRIGGDFNCQDCTDLVTLKGGPEEVAGYVRIYDCWNLKDDTYLPFKIGSLLYVKNLDHRFLLGDKCKAMLNQNIGKMKDRFIEEYDLVYNKETGRWDSNKNYINIYNSMYVNKGTFILPLGRMAGDFKCSHILELTSLLNGPTYVGGDFELCGCRHLKDLLNSPKKIDGDCKIINNPRLSSLKGITLEIGRDLKLTNLPNLMNSDFLDQVNVADIIEVCECTYPFVTSKNVQELKKAGKLNITLGY